MSWSCLVPAPCHSPQPRIAEFWFVHEPQNLVMTSEKSWVLPRYRAGVQHDVILVAPKTVRKMN